MMQSKAESVHRGLDLAERRAFMKLPLEERRRRMSEQAAEMVEHYEGRAEVFEREEWQGGGGFRTAGVY